MILYDNFLMISPEGGEIDQRWVKPIDRKPQTKLSSVRAR